jgi:hypothetical protein
VAANEPLADTSVLVSQQGVGTGSATTDSTGRYSATVSTTTPASQQLFLVSTNSASAPPAYPRLYSIAPGGGTSHVTPLTSLLVAQLLGVSQGVSGDLALLQELAPLSSAAITAARDQVVAYLSQRPSKDNGTVTAPVDVSAVSDFIRTAPVPGNGYDQALERLHASLMDTETIKGVEEHMLGRSDPAANLTSILSFDLDATCVGSGGAPTGALHISAKTTGAITVGSYARTLATGDTMSAQRTLGFDDLWTFRFTAPGDGLLLSVRNRRLVSVTLSLGTGGSTLCTPTTPLTLGERVPSLLAQIRLLEQEISDPSFTCPATAFPGLQAGTNTLVIQPNGALRVTTYSLHLPSMDFSLSADLLTSPGGPAAVVRTAGASRTFNGGFDTFGLNISPSRTITRATFSRQRGGVTQSANCPS